MKPSTKFNLQTLGIILLMLAMALLGALTSGCGTTFAEREVFYRQGFHDALTILTNGTLTNVIGTVKGMEGK